MATKITKNFHIHNAKQFIESLNEQANSLYYVTAGRHVPWSTNNTPDVMTDSLQDTYFDVYDNVSFGKKVGVNDMKHMATKYAWVSGTVYTPYSHVNGTLPDTNFFVIVTEDSGYSVFKCLDNNKGVASTQKPSIDDTAPNIDIYKTTTDGYQWKYLYSITDTQFAKFATSTKIPVLANGQVTGNAVSGAIDVLRVNSGGSRYFSVANGVIKIANVASNTLIHEIESTAHANVTPGSVSNGTFTIEKLDFFGKFTNGHINSTSFDTSNNVANSVIVAANSTLLRVVDVAGDFFGQQSNVIMQGQSSGSFANVSLIVSETSGLSANTDFYKGSIFYITDGPAKGNSSIISEYIVTGSSRRVLLANTLTNIDSSSRYEISPRVAVTDTDGTGLVARAVVNTANFTVDTIDVIERGSGYTYGTVKVYGNTGIVGASNTNQVLANGSVVNSAAQQANNANVSLVIGPPGGHGSDVVSELYGSTIGISVDFANNESGQISVNNGYRQVTLLKDPLYANTNLTLDEGGTLFPVDAVVTQSAHDDTVANGAYGTVKSRTATSLTLSNVYGNFVDTGSNTQLRISDGSSQANVTGIQSNAGRAGSTPATFDQRLTLTGYTNTNGSIELEQDEQIKQESTDATGYVESINTAANGTPISIALTRVTGNWLASDLTSDTKYNFTGQQSGSIGFFQGKIVPDLVDGSGEILYAENKLETTRSTTQTERIKLLIEF
jgi:hypothetical protein